MPVALFWIIPGFASQIFGRHLVVTSATEIAMSSGMSHNVIGLTIVSARISLLELVVSAVATLKNNIYIDIDNVIYCF
jgi:cation:H+ antiporter